jgi:subtilisin family serine protease
MTRWPLAALLLNALAACDAMPLQVESRAAFGRLSQSPEHYIVAAVENGSAAAAGHAGSTPRAYDAIAPYGPTPRARQLMKALESDYGLREVAAWPIEPLHMHCAVLELPATVDRTILLGALSHDSRIKLAQPLQTFVTRTEVYNDPYVTLQRGFQQMDVADAHPWSRGSGVKVAIIDTGADTQHQDLRGAIIKAVNLVDADEQQFRRDRHGTEIAGVIAAIANNSVGIVGIAPGASLMVFKACWQQQPNADAARCNSFTLAQALVAAMDAHAQVINLSLAGPNDELLADLIREAVRRGILLVGAAAAETPAGDQQLLHQKGVIEVASAETPPSSGTPLYAPGREILTLLPGGHYDFASGSSLATAHVTGTIALLLSKDRTLTATAAYRLLRETTAHVATDSGTMSSIDACAAVVALVGHGECKPFVIPVNRVANGGDTRAAIH